LQTNQCPQSPQPHKPHTYIRCKHSIEIFFSPS
jgi:hypothetical protein